MTREVGKSCFPVLEWSTRCQGQWCLRPTFLEGKTSCQNRGPTWETFFDVFSIGGNSVHFRSNDTFRISPSFCTTTVIDVILSVCAREKKRERPRNRIHLPRGLLIVFHSTINPSNPLESTASRISSLFSSLQLLHTFPVTLQIHQPPLRVGALLCRNAASHGTLHWNAKHPSLFPPWPWNCLSCSSIPVKSEP